VLELATGAVVAKKHGASRRAVCLSLVGGIAGALFGAGGGSIVPVLGTLIGVLLGGAGGAFVGAYLGETWKGRSEAQAVTVGSAVAVGRTLGVIGKMAVGLVMLLLVAWDAFF
jgi:phage tail tape-measure protein